MAARKKPPPPPPDVDTLSPAPVYLLFGNDEYLVSTNARKLVDRLCPEADRAFGLEVVEGAQADTVDAALEALKECLLAVQTLGFFGGRKVVWFREVALFSTARVRDSKDVKEVLEGLVGLIKAGLGEGLQLIVSAPGLDARSAFFRACKDVGHVLQYAVPDREYLAVNQARERAAALMKERGLRVHQAALAMLIDKAGTDTRQLANEIEKLALYLGDHVEITVDAIRDIVSPAKEATGFELMDAMGRRDLPESLRVLRQLMFHGMEPFGLIPLLQSRFRDLLIMKQCLANGWCHVTGQDNWRSVTWDNVPEADEALGALTKDPRKYNKFYAGRLAVQSAEYKRSELLRLEEGLVHTHQRLMETGLPAGLVLELALVEWVGGSKG